MASLLPFVITNLIPMAVVYIWINIAWFLVSFIVTLIVICCVPTQDADKKSVFLCALAGALNLYFLINPILYNYSQYFYFGDIYWGWEWVQLVITTKSYSLFWKKGSPKQKMFMCLSVCLSVCLSNQSESSISEWGRDSRFSLQRWVE